MFLGFILGSLIWTIIIGLVVGILAKVIMPGNDPGGFIITTLIGIAGSFIGTFVGRIFFGNHYTAGFIMSVLGAIVILWVYRLVMRRSTAT